MPIIDREKLQAHRRLTFRIDPAHRLQNKNDAIHFVNQRGFIFFWPIKELSLPSLWVATAGDRPVADEHNDPGHITWSWKDELLGKGVWFYGRVLARKNCMISLDYLPFFYALSPNYGEPEIEYLDEYSNGHLSLEAKNVYEILLRDGPLDSISLRRAAHLTGTGSDSRFNKALETLQTKFRIFLCGISQNGAWHYSFVYDVFHRNFLDSIQRSRTISEFSARAKLLDQYLRSVGCSTIREITHIFRWTSEEIQQTIKFLSKSGVITSNIETKGEKEIFVCLTEFIETHTK